MIAKLLGRHIELPLPRVVPWIMKDIYSADTDFRVLDDGRLYIHIRHDVLRGVTPDMLVWWFKNLEGEMELNGNTWPRYQIWHPVDHLSISYVRKRADGTIGPGAQIHLREVLCSRTDYLVDMISTIEKIDDTGLIHGPRFFGMQIVALESTFTSVPGGTLFENSLTFGPDIPILRPLFNKFVRPFMFSDDKARAWIQHNVEEVGNYEHILPGLYARYGGLDT